MFHHGYHPVTTAANWPSILWGAFLLIAGVIIVMAITRTAPKSPEDEESKEGEN